MKISVVITTRNRCEYLKRAVNSALRQTHPCEVVVVDDCSNDETAEYCRSLGNRILYYRYSSNQGQYRSLDQGIQMASGDWIKCLHDDDYMDEKLIERTISVLREHSECVICSCQAIYTNTAEEVLEISRANGKETIQVIQQDDLHIGMLLDLLSFGVPSQIALKRSIYIDHIRDMKELPHRYAPGDVYMCTRIARCGSAVFINEPLVYYTVWDGTSYPNIDLVEMHDWSMELKKDMYEEAKKKYEYRMPQIGILRKYMGITFGVLAIKRRRWRAALKLLGSSVLSINGWLLYVQAYLAKRINYGNWYINLVSK